MNEIFISDQDYYAVKNHLSAFWLSAFIDGTQKSVLKDVPIVEAVKVWMAT